MTFYGAFYCLLLGKRRQINMIPLFIKKGSAYASYLSLGKIFSQNTVNINRKLRSICRFKRYLKHNTKRTYVIIIHYRGYRSVYRKGGIKNDLSLFGKTLSGMLAYNNLYIILTEKLICREVYYKSVVVVWK